MNDRDQSNHSLEQELAGLRPQPLSREFEQRLAAALQVQPRHRPLYPRRLLIAAGGAIALTALLAVIATQRPAYRPVMPEPAQPEISVAVFDGTLPTVWAYRRAVVDPAIEIDDLLDRHRTSGATAPVEPVPRFSVSSFHSQLQMGDL